MSISDERLAEMLAMCDRASPYFAALTELQSLRAAAPSGDEVLVPRIETDDMCEAGLDALRENLGFSAAIARDAAACYRAMVHIAALSAAAKVRATSEGESQLMAAVNEGCPPDEDVYGLPALSTQEGK